MPVGGCDVAEDPNLDGRNAQPQWLASTDGWLHVRATRGPGLRRFDLWRIPGRKRLALDGSDLTLTAEVSTGRMRLTLAGALVDGAHYASAVPLTPQLRGQLETFNAHAEALEGHAPHAGSARPVSRTALLHLRALQAIDAWHASASHRDIAQALFGLEAVVLRWREDGELRAQVRHLLRRAQALMAGGYLTLAGVTRHAAKHPGDEPMR